MTEEKILTRLKTVAMTVEPFKIELLDFQSLPTHSIYINVVTRLPIKALTDQIKTLQQLMKHKEIKPHFIEQIGFTIARKLSPWQYEKAWLEYSHGHFSGRFIADHVLLLKRPVGEMKYVSVQRFDFLNLPVKTKQSTLFG